VIEHTEQNASKTAEDVGNGDAEIRSGICTTLEKVRLVAIHPASFGGIETICVAVAMLVDADAAGKVPAVGF